PSAAIASAPYLCVRDRLEVLEGSAVHHPPGPLGFCARLNASVLEILAPNDTLVSVGKTLNRSDWLLVQPWSCVVALGSGLVTARPFCRVAVTFSPTGTERLNVAPTLLCCCNGSTRVSIEVWSQPSGN